MKLVALLAISFLLFGCANKKSKEAVKARVDIVGMSKAQNLSCAGTPAKSTKSNKTEVLTYSYSGSDAAQKIQCSASLVFQRDILKSYNYSGQIGGLATQGGPCGVIVANCIKR
jgi:hypothetical protein